MWSWERLTKIQATTRPYHVWPKVWTKIGTATQNRENRNGQMKNRRSTMLEEWEEFTLSIQMTKSTNKFSRMRGENWKDLWLQPCRAKDSRASRKLLQSRKSHPRRVPKQCTVVQWNLMNPWDNLQNLRTPHTMKITLHAKDLLRCLITISVHKFIPMPKAMKIPDANAAVVK